MILELCLLSLSSLEYKWCIFCIFLIPIVQFNGDSVLLHFLLLILNVPVVIYFIYSPANAQLEILPREMTGASATYLIIP